AHLSAPEQRDDGVATTAQAQAARNRVWMRQDSERQDSGRRDEERHSGDGAAETHQHLLAPLRPQEGHAPGPRRLRRLGRLTPRTQGSAPPGTGRRTLLADWARHRIERGDLVLWVSAHAGLNAPAAFAQHLVETARAVDPGT